MSVLATVFWVWAVKRNVDAGKFFDFGAVTFPLAMGAAMTGLLRVIPSRQAGFAATSCAVVALNYFMPAPFTIAYGNWLLGMYWLLGGGVWTLLALASRQHWRRPDLKVDDKKL